MLIYVLDQAKNQKLIHYNPCLFHIDSPFNSSQEILLEFCKDLLSGMGHETVKTLWVPASILYFLSNELCTLGIFSISFRV